MGENQKRGLDERERNLDPGEGPTRGTPELNDDDLYRALAARPRRRLLYYLNDVDQSTISELAEVLVGWERSQQGEMATEQEYGRTVIELRHSHVPTLAATGLVDYDAETGIVTCEPLDADVEDLLTRSIAVERK